MKDRKVLGICGSPRKGNTEWMLRKLLDFLKMGGVDTELILLREKDIKGCDGCLACEEGGEKRKGICRIQDDMQELCPKLVDADAVALGTPVYFEMLSGQLKSFMDRTCPVWTRLKGKPIVGIAVAEAGIGKAIDNLQTYSSVCGMRWVGHATALAKTPRQVSKDKDVEKQLELLGTKFLDVLSSQ